MATPDQDGTPLERWKRTTYAKAVDVHGERRPSFRTSSDIEPDPCYAPAPEPAGWAETVGHPGEAPFTRGVQATMYRGRLWTM
ncbi:MAG: methylmalonyl-CoA mutase family protein, partial [Planctomycetota bacterium]